MNLQSTSSEPFNYLAVTDGLYMNVDIFSYYALKGFIHSTLLKTLETKEFINLWSENCFVCTFFFFFKSDSVTYASITLKLSGVPITKLFPSNDHSQVIHVKCTVFSFCTTKHFEGVSNEAYVTILSNISKLPNKILLTIRLVNLLKLISFVRVLWNVFPPKVDIFW